MLPALPLAPRPKYRLEMRPRPAALLAAVFAVLPPLARADSNGRTGRSGITGSTCMGCHSGGAAPTVAIAGPTALAPGLTGSYTLTITGGAAQVGGFDVAVDSASAALAPGAGEKKSGAELTHSSPRSFSGGSLVFSFQLTAPAAAGTVTIYGCGVSANNNGNTSGDNGATATLAITVSSGGGPDAGPTPDAGGGAPDGGGAGSDGGGGGGGDGGTGGTGVQEVSGGCSAGAAGSLSLIFAAALLRRRRATA